MERRTIKIMDDIVVDEQKYEGDNNENETDKITGELHILAVDPWTQTSILADIGTFALPFFDVHTDRKLYIRGNHNPFR